MATKQAGDKSAEKVQKARNLLNAAGQAKKIAVTLASTASKYPAKVQRHENNLAVLGWKLKRLLQFPSGFIVGYSKILAIIIKLRHI